MERPDQMIKEIVLELGAEGGSLTLFSFKSQPSTNWHFFLACNESALANFLSTEDLDGLSLTGNSNYVQTWDEALELLDNYPWPRLCPVSIHKDYSDQIWIAIKSRTDDELVLQRWRAAIH